MQTPIRNLAPADRDAICGIDATTLIGVTLLTPAHLEPPNEECALCQVVEVDGRITDYLCAMHRHASHDGEAFQWLREHLIEDFLYIYQVCGCSGLQMQQSWPGPRQRSGRARGFEQGRCAGVRSELPTRQRGLKPFTINADSSNWVE
jgi:hypothetical protein